jgi:hypothetical protein
MSTEKTLSVGILAQHPRIKDVRRISTGELDIVFGVPGQWSHVSLLFTDEEWRAVVREVDQRVAKMDAHARLEYLREQIRAEKISAHELYELCSLADYIQPGDVELAEWAGIDEAEFAERGEK